MASVDAVTLALSRLTEQFKGQPNIAALLTALVQPTQDLQDACTELLTERSISTAVGVQLDTIGDILNLPRAGLTDAVYRLYLSGKAAADRSRGLTEDLITVSRAVLAGTTSVVVVTTQTVATVVVNINNYSMPSSTPPALLSLLKEAAAAGVRVILETSSNIDSLMFTTAVAAFTAGVFSAAGVVVVNSTAGFPVAGTLIVDEGLTVQDNVTYTGITPTSFVGVSAPAHSHTAGAEMSWSASPGLGFDLTTFVATTAITAGDTTLHVTSTTGFPTTGSLDIDAGLTVQETVTYTGKTTNTFTGVSAAVNSHVLGTQVSFSGTPALGGILADAWG